MIKLDFQNFLGCNVDDYAIIRSSLLKGVSTASKLVDEFEEEIANYLNIDKNCVLATNSGTSALHLALIGSEVRKNDYVLLPVLTFAATANVIKYIGAKIVFGDVDINNWCLDKKYIEKFYKKLKYHKIEQKTFIMPVDLYGNKIDYIEYIDEEEYNAKLIIDASESFSKKRYKISTKNIDIDKDIFFCFSFNGNKIITTGAGGLLVGHKDKIRYLKKLSIQAKRKDGFYDDIGYNYRMAGINAALGLIQLKRVDEFLEKKREINKLYFENLDKSIDVQKYKNSTYWLTSVLLPEDIVTEKFKEYLLENNIETRRIFTPLHFSYPFENNKTYENAEYIYYHGLCLSSSTLCTKNDILYICKIINEGIKKSEFKVKR